MHHLKSIFLLTILLLLAIPAFGQKKEHTKEEIIRLHAPQGELISFKKDGYILSFDRKDLLSGISDKSWFSECDNLLSTTDTLDLDSTRNAILVIKGLHTPPACGIDYDLLRCFREGQVIVYSTASGKNLRHLNYITDYSNQQNFILVWSFVDTAADKELFRLVRLTVSF